MGREGAENRALPVLKSTLTLEEAGKGLASVSQLDPSSSTPLQTLPKDRHAQTLLPGESKVGRGLQNFGAIKSLQQSSFKARRVQETIGHSSPLPQAITTYLKPLNCSSTHFLVKSLGVGMEVEMGKKISLSSKSPFNDVPITYFRA